MTPLKAARKALFIMHMSNVALLHTTAVSLRILEAAITLSLHTQAREEDT